MHYRSWNLSRLRIATYRGLDNMRHARALALSLYQEPYSCIYFYELFIFDVFSCEKGVLSYKDIIESFW